MNRGTRTLTGFMTTTIWAGVGGYIAVYGTSPGWRVFGAVAIGVGLFRGALMVREWVKVERRK